MVEGIEKGLYWLIKADDSFSGKSILEIRKAVEEGLEMGHKYFLFQLADVGFVDSTGIGVMANVCKKCMNAGGFAGIIDPSDAARRVILATRLDQHMKIYDSEEEAEKDID